MAIETGKQTLWEKMRQRIPSASKGKKINMYMIQKSEELFTVRPKSSFEGEIFH